MTETTDLKKMNLSDQALGTVMMALQKSLMEQSDIVPILKSLDFVEGESGQLVVVNPPLVKMSHEAAAALEEVVMPREEDF